MLTCVNKCFFSAYIKKYSSTTIRNPHWDVLANIGSELFVRRVVLLRINTMTVISCHKYLWHSLMSFGTADILSEGPSLTWQSAYASDTGGGGLVTEHVSSHLLIGICHVISGEVNNMPIRTYVLQSNEIGFLSVNLSGSRHVFITLPHKRDISSLSIQPIPKQTASLDNPPPRAWCARGGDKESTHQSLQLSQFFLHLLFSPAFTTLSLAVGAWHANKPLHYWQFHAARLKV